MSTVTRPPVPPPWSGPAEPGVYRTGSLNAPSDDLERYAAYIRRQVIDRMAKMNERQTQETWQRRRKDPLEPHGIALLYRQGDPHALWGTQIVAATKLWLADEHGWDVHQRVFRFYQDVCEALPGLGSDVRRLADRADEGMTDAASFIGVAVSSLDTSTGTWADVVRHAAVTTTDIRNARLWGRSDPFGAKEPETKQVNDWRDVPGSFRIVLIDGTLIVVERRGRHDFNHRIIVSTNSLNYDTVNIPYPWGWATSLQLEDDPAHAEALRWLTQLGELCEQVDTARLDALHGRPRGGRP